MPSNYVKKLSKELGLSEEKIEEYWDKAKDIAKEKFEEGTDDFYAYATGILKRMLKIEGKLNVKARNKIISMLSEIGDGNS